jgi:single-stranded-DNA-specific exonuclease
MSDIAADRGTVSAAHPLTADWNVAEPTDRATVARLVESLGVTPLTAHLLAVRGITDPEEARRFLNPSFDDLRDPHGLPDIDRAVDRLARAIADKERIFVHGDYDADGVTSAALCLRALTALGADVIGYVPKRTEGYDLQIAGVERAKAAGASLILTADCGVCAIEPVRHARSLGMDVVITDHHRPGRELPDAVAVVDPFRDDACVDVRFRDLCGAAVAFKVMDALVQAIAPDHRRAFHRNFVDLVALGTVADCIPLTGENRILVAYGLRALAEGKKTGLKALLLSMNLSGRALAADDIGFRLGPRLNAAGRMEDADLAFRLLTTRDADEAEQLAVQLGALAEKSREETARVTTEALIDALSDEHLGRRVLVLARERWGKGVIGIAAARIVEQCRKPVILLSYDRETDHWHGSARTWGEFNLHAAFHDCADLLGRFGGHSAAAGISLPAANLEAVRDRLHALAEGIVPDEPVLPALVIDALVEDGAIWSFPVVEEMNRLAPFGRENPEPLFLSRSAIVLSARRVGKDGSTFTLQTRLQGMTGSIKAVWFRNGDWADRLSIGDEVDLVYTPKINEFRGSASVELSLRDLRCPRLQ